MMWLDVLLSQASWGVPSASGEANSWGPPTWRLWEANDCPDTWRAKKNTSSIHSESALKTESKRKDSLSQKQSWTAGGNRLLQREGRCSRCPIRPACHQRLTVNSKSVLFPQYALNVESYQWWSVLLVNFKCAPYSSFKHFQIWPLGRPPKTTGNAPSERTRGICHWLQGHPGGGCPAFPAEVSNSIRCRGSRQHGSINHHLWSTIDYL